MTDAAIDRFGATAHRRLHPGAAYGVLALATSALLFLVGALAARNLPTTEFGLFAALNGVLVLLGVFFTAVQTHVAAHAASGAVRSARAALRLTRPVLLTTAALMVSSLVPIALALRATVVDVALVGAAAMGLLVYATLLGVLQGSSRLTELGGLNTLQAALRVIAVLVGCAVGGVTGALALTAAVVWICVALGLPLLRSTAAGATSGETIRAPAFVLTLVVTLAIGAPTVGDVLMARAVLPRDDAGSWATAAVIGRVFVFFAAIVATAAYPTFLRDARSPHRRMTMARTGAVLGGPVALGVVVCCAFPHFALTVAAGRAESRTSAILVPYAIACAAAACGALAGYAALAHRRLLVCAVGLPLFSLIFTLAPVTGQALGAVGAAWLAAGAGWAGALLLVLPLMRGGPTA